MKTRMSEGLVSPAGAFGNNVPTGGPDHPPLPLTSEEWKRLLDLQEKLKRRQDWEHEQVESIAEELHFREMSACQLADNLIEHAESICEALAPYVKRREP